MSAQDGEPASAHASQTEPDDKEPILERQAELRAAYEENVARGKAPYAGVAIHTLGELIWVEHERGWEMSKDVDLREAVLNNANLQKADLESANLGEASFSRANLSETVLYSSNLTNANLSDANLFNADMNRANLTGAKLNRARLEFARLGEAQLIGADLRFANLAMAHFYQSSYSGEQYGANLTNARLRGADLHGAVLREAVMTGADLWGADLREANLRRAVLTGTRLEMADLSGADLRRVEMNASTQLAYVNLTKETLLADIIWNGTPLTLIDWRKLPILGDEAKARRRKTSQGDAIGRLPRREWYEDAVRANLQLATSLRMQGANDLADHFTYRAQLCQRVALRLQRKFTRYLGSIVLDLISGYGYKPLRSLIAYIVIILVFSGAYLVNAQFAAPHLTWDEALVLSISAFHGRGFFTSGISLGDTLARLAAGEAIIGLLIEITFIATFTQRFFAR